MFVKLEETQHTTGVVVIKPHCFFLLVEVVKNCFIAGLTDDKPLNYSTVNADKGAFCLTVSLAA